LAACTNEADSRRALEDAGYSEIKFEGYAPLACGKGDDTATKFIALNPPGKKTVRGTVCCGYFKGCTIRH
jgi:hypothetical protein